MLIIGGGQAGLSAAYFLERFGYGDRYLMVDRAPKPGGAWQFRWPTLTLAAANRVHDLPGYGLQESLGTDCDEIPAASGVSEYFADYEGRFGIRVRRPVRVTEVRPDPRGFRSVFDDGTEVTSTTLINATGTWESPFIPYKPGIDRFAGRQLHTHDYVGPQEFAGRRVLVIGAGISATQLLIEIARNAPGVQTFWCSRTPPAFSTEPFTPELGRAAVARVEQRVRAGLPPGSVVSVTGLSETPAIRAARADGILTWLPMFDEITETGVRWHSGDPGPLEVDTLFWNTGFRADLEHLAPLNLRNPGGGITMAGRLATHVAADPRIHLLGYGPSASTIGANRAGRAAAQEIVELL